MVGAALIPPTIKELQALAADTGFAPDRLDKVLRLLCLIDGISDHPQLGGRLALTGGTALNMFVLDAPRLSFDIDLNYIGSRDRASMLTDRPMIERWLRELFTTHGLVVKRQPDQSDHAGGK